jgi:alpha-tubulin suppressor-like RCC1 family protein
MVRRTLVGVAIVAAIVACGKDATSPTPGVPTRPTAATALALGTQFTCALTDDGKPYCWGSDLSGQLGDSSFTQKLEPTPTLGGHSYVAIAAGVQTTCALDQAGAAWCWGDDPAQAGVPVSFRNVPAIARADRPFASLTVGRKFACGLDADGNAYCWGENGKGQLGVGDTLPRPSPTRVTGGQHFNQITAGFWHVCALNASGAAYCWGDNSFGELGSGDTKGTLQPQLVTGATTFRSLGAGSVHECGISLSGAAFCWGGNFTGQLGNGAIERELAPVAVLGGLTFKSIRSYRANSTFGSTCAVTNNGDLYCWGWNSHNQLGNTDAPDTCLNGNGTVAYSCSLRPIKANGVANVTAMDVGVEHTCALTASKQLLCWGDNAHGELGDATGVPKTLPVAPTGGLRFP